MIRLSFPSTSTVSLSKMTEVKHHIDSVLYFPLLRRTGREFLSKVESFFIFARDQEEESVLFLMQEDQRILAFGNNEQGQLGLGHTHRVTTPTEIRIFRRIKVKSFKAGRNFVIAQTTNDLLYSWGLNSLGALGIGNFENKLEPVPVVLSGPVFMYACGTNHVAALGKDGTLWAWGENRLYQVNSDGPGQVNKPIQVRLNLDGEKVAQLACGARYTAVLTDQAKVYLWGTFFRFGIRSITLLNIPENINVVSMSCGLEMLTLLTEDNLAYLSFYNPQKSNWEFHLFKIHEPVLSVTNNLVFESEKFVFQLASGRLAVWYIGNSNLLLFNMNPPRTTFTPFVVKKVKSAYEAIALFYPPACTATPVSLPAHSYSEEILSLPFNNPVGSNLALNIQRGRIYINTKVALKLCPYLIREFHIPIPDNVIHGRNQRHIPTFLRYGRPWFDLEIEWFSAWFLYLETLHTERIEVIEDFCAHNLMDLATKDKKPMWRDLFLHHITAHMLPRDTRLPDVLEQYVRRQIPFDLVTVANAGDMEPYFNYIFEDDTTREEARRQVWNRVASESLATAKLVCKMLYKLSHPQMN